MRLIKGFFKYIGNCIGYMVFKHKMKVAIFEAVNHGDEWIKFATKLAVAYKDATPEEIRKDLIMDIAEKVHEDNKNNKTEK